MLLKYQQAQKRIKTTGIGKPQRTAGGMVRLTSGAMTVVPKIHRRVIKVASKRPSAIHRPAPVKREQIPIDPCENSNDSGLGFDHHIDYHSHTGLAPPPHPLTLTTLRFSDKETVWPTDEPPEVKRRRLEIKLESDDANDNFTFPETVRQQPPPPSRPVCVAVRGRSRGLPMTLSSQLTATSSDGRTQLIIACQPEQQHRARYQTEGSRGAVKDRTGNGFPVVKLVGYDRPAVLQVFIGTDQGRVAPHMFYQACRVSGKNSTPCAEKKLDGTIVIEVDMEPAKDMVVTCDCVGILKERNVDVEHRFPEESSGRSKKKSTRCRMVFRTTILLPDGSQETLQATSQPIVCTQPPGVPEICKKSLSSCGARGGLELFILGKNFLKDTKVVFQEGEWVQKVQPDKEFLQQSHLVCVVPAYEQTDIAEPVAVRLVVESSGKASEPHTFTYLPSLPGDNSEHNSPVLGLDGSVTHRTLATGVVNTGAFRPHHSIPPLLIQSEPGTHFLAAQTSPRAEEKPHPVMMWEKSPEVLMPPPAPALLPVSVRRSSVQMIVPEVLAPENLKKETPEVVEPPKQMANVSDLSSAPPPSIDTFHRFVSESSLPSINVSNYLSNIENKTIYSDKVIKSHMISEMPHIMIPPSSAVNKPMFTCNSANLLTTVEAQEQSSGVPFENRNVSPKNPHIREEHMSVIVSSALLQEKSQDLHMMNSSGQMASTNNVKHEILMPSVIKQDQTGTERLDAFVNSAAESHISPNPASSSQISSVVTETSMMSSTSEMMGNGTDNLTMTSSLPITLNSSPETGPDMNEHNCSFINNTPQNSPERSQLDIAVKSSPDNGMCSKHEIMSPVHLVHSPTKLSSRQDQDLASLQVTLGHQLSQPTTSSQVLQNEINNLIHNQVQTSLEQQISSPVLSQEQINQNNLNTMLQSLPHSSNQEQNLQDIKVSLSQQLPPQSIMSNSSQMNNHQLANLIQATEQEIRNKVQTLNNFQASIEHHLSAQNMVTSQIVQSEAEQQSHLSLNNMRTSPIQPTISKAEVYSKIQASIQHELSSQMLASSQASHEPMMVHSESVSPLNLASIRMENHLGSVAQNCSTNIQSLSNLQASLENHMSPQMIISTQINNDQLVNGCLNASMPTSPNHIQNSVTQAQALSNLQASLDNYSTQVMNQSQSLIEATRSLTSSPNTSIDSSQVSPNRSTIQMSLNELSPSLVSSSQPNHSSMSLNNIQAPHVNVTQVTPDISSFQPTFEQQLRSEMMAAETVLPLEHLHSSQTANQAISMSSLPSSLIQTGRVDCLASNSMTQMGVVRGMPLSDTVSLMTSQPLNVTNMTSQLSPVMLSSTTSCQSSTTVLVPSEITMPQSNYSPEPMPCTVALNPSIQDTAQTVNITAPNMMLSTSQSILTSDSLINNNSSNLTISPNMTSGQAPNQFQESKEPKREDPAYTLMQQTPAPGVKKCEDGIPQVPNEITQMSEHDLISYINPSCFDTV